MPADRARREILSSYSDGLFERLEFLENCDEHSLRIQQGLFFLMAFWSGPSVVGFKNICRVFKQIGLPGTFVFRVLDIDGASDSLLSSLSQHGITIGGNAEGYWIRNGRIFAATACHTGTNSRIQQLLAEATQP